MSSYSKSIKVPGTTPSWPGQKQHEEAQAKAEAARSIGSDKAELKKIRQEEDVYKEMLIKREEENFTRIFAFKCYDGWLRIYDNSAVVLSRWLDGRLGRSYEMKPDMGYSIKAKYGAVSVPPASVGELIERLAKAGIPLKSDEVWTLEFELGERVDKDKMIEMLHEDELLTDRVNKLVMPYAKFPNLRAGAKILLELVHSQTLNQKKFTQEVIAGEAERRAIELNRLLIATARGRVKLNDCLMRANIIIEDLYLDATTMSDMKIITARKYEEFVKKITQVQSDIARERKKMEITAEPKEGEVATTKKGSPKKTKGGERDG